MLKPVRYDLFHKALNKQPKTKVDKRMITVEQCLLFAEWANERYYRDSGRWRSKADYTATYTTRELWEAYNRFLGAKPANPNTAP
jgi:hypothetical protein